VGVIFLLQQVFVYQPEIQLFIYLKLSLLILEVRGVVLNLLHVYFFYYIGGYVRIKIDSTDRLGISQEILSVVAKRQFNVIAMEVIPRTIFLHIDINEQHMLNVFKALSTVDGVLSCKRIDFLPIESREHHLNAMLSKIPDPIFDISANGVVISCNLAIYSEDADKNDKPLNVIGKSITTLFGVEKSSILTSKPNSLDVYFSGKQYIAETIPVIVEGVFNGVVVHLKAIASIGRQLSLLQQGEGHHTDNIIGDSEEILILKDKLNKFSRLDLPILLTGETGTGKELFARAIHEASGRRDKAFLAINCASLPEQLLESELFGYAAGAFTGAQRSGKPGLFELAHGGTVFLDEIAEMSGYLQAKLLRFLQDYSYRRLGGTKEFTANVRIISASHQPFDQMIKNRIFREDLYYRLNVLSLALPALRERRQDISLLCFHFLANAAKQVNQPEPVLDESALLRLIEYSWPGNIRQLQNVLFRLVALNNGHNISLIDVTKVLADFGDNHEEVSRHSQETQRNWLSVKNWQTAQAIFEDELLAQFWPVYPSTRKLAERLGVSHNKIAMKLRKKSP
jgi:TyrR family helix-turn-helix protein